MQGSRRIIFYLSLLMTVGILSCLFATNTPVAQASTVKAARGTKFLLKLDGNETRHVGDIIENGSASHPAKLVIVSIHGREAVGELQEGDVETGDHFEFNGERFEHAKMNTVEEDSAPEPEPTPRPRRRRPQPTPEPVVESEPEPEPEATPPPKPRTEPKRKRRSKPKTGNFWSVVAGASQQNQTVNLSSSAQVSLTGTTPFVRASLYGRFSDMKSFGWQGGVGIDQVNTTGSIASAACAGSTSCSYQTLSLSPFVRGAYYIPFLTLAEPQLRLGVDFLLPFMAQSNVIAQPTFTPILFFTGGFGLSFGNHNDSAFPIGIDYAIYIGNSNVSMARILLSAGYSWR